MSHEDYIVTFIFSARSSSLHALLISYRHSYLSIVFNLLETFPSREIAQSIGHIN